MFPSFGIYVQVEQIIYHRHVGIKSMEKKYCFTLIEHDGQ